MNEKKKKKKQFRLNLNESFERRIRTPEPFYNEYEDMRKEPLSTPNNIENIFGEVTRQHQQLQQTSADTQSSSNMQSDVRQDFNLGDAVMISGQEGGVIRYLGNVHFQVIHSNDVGCCQELSFLFQPGVWAGVELINPVGLHGGLVDNVEYFCCQPRHGVFAPLWTIELVQDRDQTYMDHSQVDLPHKQR